MSVVDATAPDDGSEPTTTKCTRLIRVESMVATPTVVANNPGKFAPTFTYFYLGDDGAIVMTDAGFTLWITGGTKDTPTIEENTELLAKLDAAVAALVPGKSLADVAPVYSDRSVPG